MSNIFFSPLQASNKEKEKGEEEVDNVEFRNRESIWKSVHKSRIKLSRREEKSNFKINRELILGGKDIRDEIISNVIFQNNRNTACLTDRSKRVKGRREGRDQF